MNSVISCPRCLRQYRANAALNGKQGNCSTCNSYFVISVPSLTAESGEAIVFDNPLEPHYVFFMEGCMTISAVSHCMLRIANEQITSANVIEFVRTMPRSL